MTDANNFTLRLGGSWHGHYGTAPCPVCQIDRRPDQKALTIRDGDEALLLHCKKSNCRFREILAAAGLELGRQRPLDKEEFARRIKRRQAEADRKARQAERLWQEAQPVSGTIAERYLRETRGIACTLPASLRFHPRCWHGPTSTRHPALIALVSGGDGIAVHRTYLQPSGSGKADLDPNKMMLGATAGGYVNLTSGKASLIVGEGIESALSAYILSHRPSARVWAALSTSGMRALRLPAEPSSLILAPDGDAAGLTAARSLSERARSQGWTVSIMTPPSGVDFNDILIMKRQMA